MRTNCELRSQLFTNARDQRRVKDPIKNSGRAFSTWQYSLDLPEPGHVFNIDHDYPYINLHSERT